MHLRNSHLGKKCFAEGIGTYLLIFFGCGSVHTAILTGSLTGLWQVAMIWGVAIMAALYVVGPISGAHINPAITVAFAMRARFPWRFVPAYVISQTVGAFCAAATLFVLFSPWLDAKEKEKGVIRGDPGSEITAMCYGEYFPNPGPLATAPGPYSLQEAEKHNQLVSEPVAFLTEMLGTMILAAVVFAVTDPRNPAGPGPLAPMFIGLTVAALVAFIAPLTQACFNPARDFGPRLLTLVAGWGKIALPGSTPTGWLTVYIIAPLLGAVLGATLYDGVFRASDSGNPEP